MKYKSLFIVIASCIASVVYAQDANKILDKVAQSANLQRGVEISFTANGAQGTLQIKGKKFRMQAGGATIWYDGKTQWTYMQNTNEVNISTPTAAEVAQGNPQSWISSYRTAYTAKYISKSGNTHNITLTSKGKNGIKTISLQINATTNKPQTVTITTNNNQTTNIAVKQFTTKAVSDEIFKFNSKQYPNADIIDLR